MQAQKTIHMMGGEVVEVLVTGEMSGGAVTVLRQATPPGGGPPPHRHTREDELFRALEGEYEFFDGTSWTPLVVGQLYFGPRNNVHTFRNAGTTTARIEVVVTPGGFENFLEQLAQIRMPQDAEKLSALSKEYGVQLLV